MITDMSPEDVAAEAANWSPLELILTYEQCNRFMFMGTSGELFLYKHIDTRRYLNLNGDGDTFRYDSLTGNYQPYPRARAIAEAFA